MQEERSIFTAEEISEKTLNSLKRLGEQKFAVSPFSQYFNSWLINLKDVLSEFESNSAIGVDEAFVKERERVIAKLERELADIKRDEATLNIAVKDLADHNHLLVEIDAEYVANTREIGPKGNAEIQRLTKEVQNLEEELARVKAMKTSFFGSFTKKAKGQKEAELLRKLESAKKTIESAIQKFKVEQEKLHDEYEKKKQAVMAQVQVLEKEVEKLETDVSPVARHAASEALVYAVSALLERKPASPDGATS
jgi:DNA repair exonuclease SbcCD ATPase subunit